MAKMLRSGNGKNLFRTRGDRASISGKGVPAAAGGRMCRMVRVARGVKVVATAGRKFTSTPNESMTVASSENMKQLENAVSRVSTLRQEVQKCVSNGEHGAAQAKLAELRKAVEVVTGMQEVIESAIGKIEKEVDPLSPPTTEPLEDPELEKLRKENDELASEMESVRMQIDDAESNERRMEVKGAELPKIRHGEAKSILAEPPTTMKAAYVEPVISSPSNEALSRFVETVKGDVKVAVMPPGLVAGSKSVICFNSKKSYGLADAEQVKMTIKFNEWALDGKWAEADLAMSRVEGGPGDGSNWWYIEVDVPEAAYSMNFVFFDGFHIYDNNNEQNYRLETKGEVDKERWEKVIQPKMRAEAQERTQVENEKNRAKGEMDDIRDRVERLQIHTSNVIERNGETAMYTRPMKLAPGQHATIYYNSAHTPLHNVGGVKMTLGHSGWLPNWTPRYAMQKERVLSSNEDNQWWSLKFLVPESAVELNIAVSDEVESLWDNNMDNNYSLGVSFAGTTWEQRIKARAKELTDARHEAARLEKEREEKSLIEKKKQRVAALSVRRAQQRFVLTTKPAEPKAGEEVTVSYTPANTCLNGAQDVYLCCGFNHWTHAQNDFVAMGRRVDGSYEVAVSIPQDAYTMDFCFTDAWEHGRYDNKGGLDYHIPIKSDIQEPPLHVVHITVEMAPIAKVGGLGDVVTSLGRAVQESGNVVEVIMPWYDFLMHSPLLGSREYETSFAYGGCDHHVHTCIVEGLRVFFIESMNGYFNTGSVYGRDDDGMRFDFFSKCALEFLLQTQRQPDILHSHDWSTAMVSRFLMEDYHHYGLGKPRSVFTIHNMNYGQAKLGDAAYNCAMFTTVSPQYANEVRDSPVVQNSEKFKGVRNGIDNDIWDPFHDQYLPVAYNANNFVIGKGAARKALQERLGMAQGVEAPLIGVVSRLTAQKGIHLIKQTAYRSLDRGCQFALLGSAPDPKIQGDFNGLAGQLGGDMACFYYAYDEPLSHLVYAACDIIVVPSMFEPCGLTQLIAMRYGAVPVVRQTGGLYDTVFDVDHDKERAAWEMFGSCDFAKDGVDGTNGFSFEGTDEGALDYALNRAIDTWYNDRNWFQGLQKRAMMQDWTWNRPALDYMEIYHAAKKQ